MTSTVILIPPKSSLVLRRPVRTPGTATQAAVLDLCAVDSCRVKNCGPHFIDMAGTYAGYVVGACSIKVEQGAAFHLVIKPRRPAAQEAAIVDSWENALLGKIRAELASIAVEYLASGSTVCDFYGTQV